MACLVDQRSGWVWWQLFPLLSRRLPHHGGHLQYGKRGEVSALLFEGNFGEISLTGDSDSLSATRGVNRTPHRAHFAHAIFSRVRLKIESQIHCEASRSFLNICVCHSRASCLIRTRHGLIFHPSQSFHSASFLHVIHLTVMNTPLIHRQQDGLVDWPYKVLSQGSSPVAELSHSGVTHLSTILLSEGKREVR